MKIKRLTLFLLMFLASEPVWGIPFPWKHVTSYPETPKAISSRYDTMTIVVLSEEGKLWVSTNYCQSWTDKSPPSGPITYICPDLSIENAWYCVVNQNGWKLFKSSSNCESWSFEAELPGQPVTLVPSSLKAGLILGTFLSGKDSSDIILMKSENGGVNWKNVLEQTGLFIPVWHSTSAWEAFISFYHSTDFGETWSKKSKNIISACTYNIPPQILSATDIGLLSSTDALNTWWPLLNEKVNYVTLNPGNSNQILSAYLNGDNASSVYYSSTSGKDFSSWGEGLPTVPLSDVKIVSEWLFLAIAGNSLYIYDERPADMDHSGRIDGGDLVILSLAFGSMDSEARYNPIADLNKDGAVDGTDLMILSSVWGHNFYSEGFPPNPWDQNQ